MNTGTSSISYVPLPGGHGSPAPLHARPPPASPGVVHRPACDPQSAEHRREVPRPLQAEEPEARTVGGSAEPRVCGCHFQVTGKLRDDATVSTGAGPQSATTRPCL